MNEEGSGTPPVTPPEGTAPPVTPVTPPEGAANLTPAQMAELLAKETKDRQEANKEAQALRTRLRALEAEDAERKKAAMTDAEKLTARLAELEAANAQLTKDRQEFLRREAVNTAAQKLGVIDLDAAYRLLDPATLTLGDDGRPTNAEEALKALLKDKPYLLGGNNSAPTNGNRGAGADVGREQELREMIYGTPGGAFDVARIRAKRAGG